MILLGTSQSLDRVALREPPSSLLYCYNGEEVIQMRQSAARCISGCVSSGPGHMIQPDAPDMLLLLLLVHKRNLRRNFGTFKLRLLINIPLKRWSQRGGWHQPLHSGGVFFPAHSCARSYPPNTTHRHKHKQGHRSEKTMSSFMGDAKDLSVTCIIVVEVSQMPFWWPTVP